MYWAKRLARPAVEDGHESTQSLASSLRHGETKERQAPTGSAQIGRMIDGCPPSSSDLAGFSTGHALERMIKNRLYYYVLVYSRTGPRIERNLAFLSKRQFIARVEQGKFFA